MKTADYWKDRFEQIEKICHDKGAVTYREIEEQYRKAQREIESQISVWYQRFAVNNGITMQEARRLLTSGELAELKWDVNDYIKYGQQNAIDGKWMKQLENASARAHISRLEALKLQLQQQVEVVFGNQLDGIDKAMRAVYSAGYLHTAFEIQKGTGIGYTLAAFNQTLIDKILNRPWAPDGKNFSDRVWSNKQKLINELNTTLTQGIILGKDPSKIINAMSKKLDVSKTAAGRLVMTESAAFASRAQEDCFKELGVEEYEIVATLDSHTSEICQDMDGKVFKMSEREIGLNAPPFHVNCRTTTVPYFNDGWSKNTERAARNEDGDTYYVPENMTYKEWEKGFVKNLNIAPSNAKMVLKRDIQRKEMNIGAFSNLKIPMQKRKVREIAQRYDIDLTGLTIKIQRSEKLLTLPIAGSTDYKNIGRIDLFPNAFIDEEQLVRTLIHEKCHVNQLKEHGFKYVQANLIEMEKEAYETEALEWMRRIKL